MCSDVRAKSCVKLILTELFFIGWIKQTTLDASRKIEFIVWHLWPWVRSAFPHTQPRLSEVLASTFFFFFIFML
jgi:hypothetical protein